MAGVLSSSKKKKINKYHKLGSQEKRDEFMVVMGGKKQGFELEEGREQQGMRKKIRQNISLRYESNQLTVETAVRSHR